MNSDELSAPKWEVKRPLTQAWANWPLLKDFDWNYYVTFTFPTVTKTERAERIWKRFTDKTAKKVLSARSARKQGLPWVCAFETHKSGSVHIHALLGGVDSLTFDEVAQQWLASSGSKIVDIQVYNPKGNALSYIAKSDDVVVARYFNYT